MFRSISLVVSDSLGSRGWPVSAAPSPIEDLVSRPSGWQFWSLVMATVLTVAGVLTVAWGLRRQERPPADKADSAPTAPPPGGLVFALRHYRGWRSEPLSPSGIPVPGDPAAKPPLPSFHYEAVEYLSESWSSKAEPRTLGQFTTLQEAIDAARRARSSFVLDSPAEAFWVVWNHHLKRAAWVAESGTPGESVIDLTTRRREPSSTQSTRTR